MAAHRRHPVDELIGYYIDSITGGVKARSENHGLAEEGWAALTSAVSRRSERILS